MSTSKHVKDTKDNSIKQSNGDTTKIINQTFDDAKNKARKAIDETHKGLPRYMQTVTNNQEQPVNARKKVYTAIHSDWLCHDSSLRDKIEIIEISYNYKFP